MKIIIIIKITQNNIINNNRSNNNNNNNNNKGFREMHKHREICPVSIYIFTVDSSALNSDSREKIESGPRFEPRTSRSLAWRSTT